MSKALSMDLRDRVVRAIEDGMSCRQAAVRFGVSASSAIRWRALSRRQGDVRPGPLGGDRRSARIEAHSALILELLKNKDDVTLAEIKASSIWTPALWCSSTRREPPPRWRAVTGERLVVSA
jgi:transposase